MDLNTFLDHFDTIAEAPGGIPKLKALILDLAVRGKLVPQNLEDEPAEVLRNQIIVEKQKLEKSKKIAKQRSVIPVQETELPYAIPNNWSWCRWNDVALHIGDIDHKMPTEVSEGIPYVSPRNFKGANIIDFEGAKKISLEDFERLKIKVQPAKGDIIFPRYGTIGENRLVEVDINFLASYSCAIVKNLHGYIEPKYSYYYSLSKLVKSEIERYTNKTTQANVGIQSIQNFVYPLPPLAEQKRIVEKVDELMALCDRLAAAKQTRDDLRQKLRGSAISSLMNAETDEALEESWAIVRDNWHSLSQDPKDVNELRQPILKLALQGKLTSPIFSKVVLEELIERFVAERLTLHLSEQDKKKILLELDKTYKRLEEKDSQLTIAARCICDFITKGTTPANNELLSRGEIPYIKVYNIVEQELNFFYKPTYISREVHETKLKRSKVLPGDVLMNIVGPPLGKVAIVPDTFQEWNLNQALAIFRPLPSVNKRFLYYALSCYATLKTVLNETRGTAGQDNLSLEQCRDLQIPVFTVEDQGRIVAKVDELMQMCNQLEESLRQSQQRASALAASAISHLTI